MAIVLDVNFSGTAGSTFSGNAVFSPLLGTQTIRDTDHSTVKALRFPAASQSVVQASISGTPTVRTLSRIGKISALPTATSEILQVRSTSARGAGLQVLGTTGNEGKLRIVDPNGTALTGAGTSSGTVPIGVEFRYTLAISGTTVTATAYTDTSGTTVAATCTATVSATTAMALERDGLLTAGGFGAGITFDMSWPKDSDNTTDPGPRNYGSLGSSTIVFDHDWDGVTGSTFAGDDFYSIVIGAAPTYVRTSRGGKAPRFPDEQSIITHSFSTVTSRVFSRVYRLNAPVTVRSEVLQTRIGTARGPAIAFTETNKLLLMRTDGSAVITGDVDLPVNQDFRVTFIVAGTSISALLFLDDVTTTVADSLSGSIPAAASMTSVREGIITATGLGTDVTLDLIWPQEDSAVDPGPRTYPSYPVNQPTVYAGADLTELEPYRVVTLEGVDVEDGIPITARTWTQVSGPDVTSSWSGTGKTRTYEAPGTIGGATLVFQYTATTASGTVSDTVSHTVLPVNEHMAIGGVWVPMRKQSPVADGAMPIGDLVGWQQVFTEDFLKPVPVGGFYGKASEPLGGQLLTTGLAGYNAYGPGRTSGNEMRVYADNWNTTGGRSKYAPSKALSIRDDVAGANGVFDVWLHTDTPAGGSAAVPVGVAAWFPIPYFSNAFEIGPYVRVDFRLRTLEAVGPNPTQFHVVPLLIGNPWPDDGESDYPEGEAHPLAPIRGWYHRADPAGTQEQIVGPAGAVMGDWHVYTHLWTPGQMQYLLDGTVIKTSTTMVPTNTMAFVLQFEPQLPLPAASTSVRVQVDWLTIYRYNP